MTYAADDLDAIIKSVIAGEYDSEPVKLTRLANAASVRPSVVGLSAINGKASYLGRMGNFRIGHFYKMPGNKRRPWAYGVVKVISIGRTGTLKVQLVSGTYDMNNVIENGPVRTIPSTELNTLLRVWHMTCPGDGSNPCPQNTNAWADVNPTADKVWRCSFCDTRYRQANVNAELKAKQMRMVAEADAARKARLLKEHKEDDALRRRHALLRAASRKGSKPASAPRTRMVGPVIRRG